MLELSERFECEARCPLSEHIGKPKWDRFRGDGVDRINAASDNSKDTGARLIIHMTIPEEVHFWLVLELASSTPSPSERDSKKMTAHVQSAVSTRRPWSIS